MRRSHLTAPVLLALGLLAAEPAYAAVSVARAELSGSRLRLEGTALASRDITADGVVLGRSDSSGAFRIERDPFTPPADCTIDVGDGSATATTARLAGCTVVVAPPPPAPADTSAPTAPTNLTARVVGATVSLIWTASLDNVGVTAYRVSRNGVAVGTAPGIAFDDSGLAAGSYVYTVTALDAAGNVSGASNTASATVTPAPPPPAADTVAPSVPVGLTTTIVGTTVGLNWGLSTDNIAVTGYRVVRNGVLLGTTNDTTFPDTGLAPGSYTYTVAAFDAAGNTSAASSPVSATVEAFSGLAFITPAQLPVATVGQPYLASIVVNDPPGPSTFRFKLVSGRVPPGTRFSENTLPARPEARVTGTPTAAGTSSFAVEVQDNTGAVVRRTFSITVLAR